MSYQASRYIFSLSLIVLGSKYLDVSCYSTWQLSSSRWGCSMKPDIRRHQTHYRESRKLSNFYDDFEDFGNLGSSGDLKGSDIEPSKTSSKPENDIAQSADDAVMKSLRERMNDLSQIKAENDEEEDEDEYVDSDEVDVSDLDRSSFSSIDDLIQFARSKARQKEENGNGKGVTEKRSQDEIWATPIPHIDKVTGKPVDFDDILKDGVILIANPSKFYPDIADKLNKEKKEKRKGGFNVGRFFEDPFPIGAQQSGISPALLAKFGIMAPPTPDQGPDRRATILPVLFLVERDPIMGCKAVTVNRRSGALIGDLASEWNKTSELGAFFIQPVWEGGTGMIITSRDSITLYENTDFSKKVIPLDLLHMCPYVIGSTPMTMCEGLYWGGDPCQLTEAMKDYRLEKPMTGFDFKFFFKDTKWLPNQLEKEIMEGTWFVAKVSKEVLFKNRDRLGPMRSKPLWKEIMELLGNEYKHILDLLYGDEENKSIQ